MIHGMRKGGLQDSILRSLFLIDGFVWAKRWSLSTLEKTIEALLPAALSRKAK